ncbi:RDD family protein [Halopiger aswanensis]|uniref:Putative RDD family membrane protein YckC n=1 Tax=Halopiger aswanensis TaxID=148449 RepID=A0A3R7DBM0_9EURY|nr:RDD family protein [Halopiger aswanensis]RKD97397.1 putative RDD family membrane protein YckC [Halopiger aswanensis]
MVGSRRSTLNHAGLLERGVAWFVDGIVMFILLFVAIALVLLLFSPGATPTEVAEGIAVIVGLVVSTAYYMVTEAKWGQTPGKMLLGLRVVHLDGRPCTGAGAVIRNVTKVLGGSSLFPVVVAIVLVLSSDNNQRLGDMLGDTAVVTE